MTSHQTKTGNNFIMPIILTLVSAFVITDTLSTDNDKNLEDNLAVVQQETTDIVSDERAIDENVTEQPAALTEAAQTTETTSTDTSALDLAAKNVALADDNAITIINPTEDTTEVTEPGVTSSTPALAENVALEIFEINTTATTEAATKETQEDAPGNTVNTDTTAQAAIKEVAVKEAAPQELIAQAISQEQDSQNTDTAIPADEDPSESMPAATAPVTPTTTAVTLTEAEAKSEAIVQPEVESPAQKVTQATTEQTKDGQVKTPEFVAEVPLKPSTKVSTESKDPAANASGINDQLVDNSNANSNDDPGNNPAINKPIFITPDENKLIFISQADSHTSNPALNNKTTAQNRTAPNYAHPPQNRVNQNYSTAQNQYQQYLYQQQRKQQRYYAEMQQRQQAQQRAQQQAYQNEMKARQQRYLTEMKAKQEQHKKALAADKKNSLQSQQIQLNAEQKIQQIQQKISQLNEEIRQLKNSPETTQKLAPAPAATQNTAPISKQM